MAELPELWDPIGAVIDAGTNVPLRVDGSPILDRLDADGHRWPRYYRGVTYPNAAGDQPPPGYVLLGLTILPENDGYNGEDGRDATVRMHAWAETPDDAKRLAAWLVRLLHHVALSVPGFDPVVGTVSTNGPSPDATGTGWQVECTYSAEALETA